MSINCDISPEGEKRLLNLPYEKFDQTFSEGWRKYADRGCYQLSAELLDKYFELHKDMFMPWQKQIITWHAGQMYAFDDNYEFARIRFNNSFDPDEGVQAKILWNDYVHATISFLNKDIKKLKFHREKIASGPELDGKKPNLNVVDNLIKCFNKPYRVAYSGCNSE